jgi:hypothetical protein
MAPALTPGLGHSPQESLVGERGEEAHQVIRAGSWRITRASTLLCEALTNFRAVKDAWGVVYTLVYLVAARAGEGHADPAATLAGAVSTLCRLIGAELISPLQAAYAPKLAGTATTLRLSDSAEPMTPLQAAYDAAVAAVRQTMGETAFAAA